MLSPVVSPIHKDVGVQWDNVSSREQCETVQSADTCEAAVHSCMRSDLKAKSGKPQINGMGDFQQ